MSSQTIDRSAAGKPASRGRALLAGAVVGLAILAPLPVLAEDAPAAEQPQSSSGFVHGAKELGRAVGLAFHDIGQGAKRIGLEIGHGAAQVGREIGHAAKESGKAFAHAIRGERRDDE